VTPPKLASLPCAGLLRWVLWVLAESFRLPLVLETPEVVSGWAQAAGSGLVVVLFSVANVWLVWFRCVLGLRLVDRVRGPSGLAALRGWSATMPVVCCMLAAWHEDPGVPAEMQVGHFGSSPRLVWGGVVHVECRAWGRASLPKCRLAISIPCPGSLGRRAVRGPKGSPSQVVCLVVSILTGCASSCAFLALLPCLGLSGGEVVLPRCPGGDACCLLGLWSDLLCG